jgi:hypothetical protein
MSYISEMKKFINDTDESKLKEYYNKSFETLKDINKRSNTITIFVLILLICGNFPDLISENRVLGFKISTDLIAIVSPLLTSFFIMEWCLIARRRRELMRIMKDIGYKVFNTHKIENKADIFEFSLINRNIIPLSLMVEILNIDTKNIFYHLISVLSIISLWGGTIFLLIRTYYKSFTQYDLPTAGIVCNVFGLYCCFQIILFYISDFKLIRTK